MEFFNVTTAGYGLFSAAVGMITGLVTFMCLDNQYSREMRSLNDFMNYLRISLLNIENSLSNADNYCDNYCDHEFGSECDSESDSDDFPNKLSFDCTIRNRSTDPNTLTIDYSLHTSVHADSVLKSLVLLQQMFSSLVSAEPDKQETDKQETDKQEVNVYPNRNVINRVFPTPIVTYNSNNLEATTDQSDHHPNDQSDHQPDQEPDHNQTSNNEDAENLLDQMLGDVQQDPVGVSDDCRDAENLKYSEPVKKVYDPKKAYFPRSSNGRYVTLNELRSRGDHAQKSNTEYES